MKDEKICNCSKDFDLMKSPPSAVLKYVKIDGSIKSSNVGTPDVVPTKEIIPNLRKVKNSLNKKLDKISINTKFELPGNECNLPKVLPQTSTCEYIVTLSDQAVDDIDSIEEVNHPLEYTRVEAYLSK